MWILIISLEHEYFSADYKSNDVILEGVNAIKLLHSLVDKSLQKEMPLFFKLYDFFANKKTELELKFDELI